MNMILCLVLLFCKNRNKTLTMLISMSAGSGNVESILCTMFFLEIFNLGINWPRKINFEIIELGSLKQI